MGWRQRDHFESCPKDQAASNECCNWGGGSRNEVEFSVDVAVSPVFVGDSLNQASINQNIC